jgi:hypothetical protein
MLASCGGLLADVLAAVAELGKLARRWIRSQPAPVSEKGLIGTDGAEETGAGYWRIQGEPVVSVRADRVPTMTERPFCRGVSCNSW